MANEFTLHPDTTLIVTRNRVVGGKKATREVIRDDLSGRAREIEARIEIVIDDVEERKEAEKLLARVNGIIRRMTTHTLIGTLAPRDRVGAIRDTIAESATPDIEDFNARAKTCRVDVSILPIDIAIALGAEAVRAIADNVRERLETLRDALRAGDVAKTRSTLFDSKNLRDLAVGVQAESLQFAIEEGCTRLIELKALIKGDGAKSETPESAGRSLDLTMIESAIGMFAYSANYTQPALPEVA